MKDRMGRSFAKWVIGGAIGALVGFHFGGIRGALLGAFVGAAFAWALVALLTSGASRELTEELSVRPWPLILVLLGFIAAGFYLGFGHP